MRQGISGSRARGGLLAYALAGTRSSSRPSAPWSCSVVELLIHHVRYRDSYATAMFHDAEIVYGPYWLEAITVESFSPISSVAAEALITTWANYGAPIPESDQVAFERYVYPPIRTANTVYQLADLRATAEHGWGSVIGFSGFYEFVAVNPHVNQVTLIVASDD